MPALAWRRGQRVVEGCCLKTKAALPQDNSLPWNSSQTHWPGPHHLTVEALGLISPHFPPKEMLLSPLSLITQPLSDWSYRESPGKAEEVKGQAEIIKE